MHLEIVCCTPEDCRLAEAGGATRIELCCAIELGGLTPTAGLMAGCRGVTTLPIVAMLRMRGGPFAFTKEELAVMVHDARPMAEEGMDGIVFGALRQDGGVDAEACRNVSEVTELPLSFHRAFDQTPNAFDALDELASLDLKRVLSSGHAATAQEGADHLRLYREFGKVEVLPGGGIRAHNAREILAKSGCEQLHLAPFKGGRVDVDEVRRVREIMNDALRSD